MIPRAKDEIPTATIRELAGRRMDNLCKLSRDCGVNVRVLRRIKHGHTKTARYTTAERVLEAAGMQLWEIEELVA